MGDPMPRWQVFSSEADQESETPGQTSGAVRSARPRPLLVGLIGLSLLAGVVALAAATALTLQFAGGPLTSPEVGVPFATDLAGMAVERGPTFAGITPPDIVIDVGGAVARPGLQRLPPGARVGDAIDAAGGFASRADLAAASSELNLAQALEDGAKVFVPSLGTSGPLAGPAGNTSSLIDLNRADQASLETLPGIGPVTAGRIIEARAERRFAQVQDLRTRGLVGASVFSDIESLVQVR